MSNRIARAEFVAAFTCLGPACEDTCCKAWDMQMNDSVFARYKQEAPELVEAVAVSDVTGGRIMRRDATDHCVKLIDGGCGIQAQYGTDFLSDACHFYPRATRRLGNTIVMSATASCPEIARLGLFGDAPFVMSEAAVERLPESLRDYLSAEMNETSAVALHQLFLDAALAEDSAPEQTLLRLISASQSLDRLPQNQWLEIAPMALKFADGKLAVAEQVAEDPFNLLHLLIGILTAAHKAPSPRLSETIVVMEQALATTIDWQSVSITTAPESLSRYRQMRTAWQQSYASVYAILFKRWLAMQLSLNLFPFSGLGATMMERSTLLAIRFTLMRLAVMSQLMVRGEMSDADFIRIVQSLARVMDHLGDATLMLTVAQETGWLREARLRGMLEG